MSSVPGCDGVRSPLHETSESSFLSALLPSQTLTRQFWQCTRRSVMYAAATTRKRQCSFAAPSTPTLPHDSSGSVETCSSSRARTTEWTSTSLFTLRYTQTRTPLPHTTSCHFTIVILQEMPDARLSTNCTHIILCITTSYSSPLEFPKHVKKNLCYSILKHYFRKFSSYRQFCHQPRAKKYILFPCPSDIKSWSELISFSVVKWTHIPSRLIMLIMAPSILPTFTQTIVKWFQGTFQEKPSMLSHDVLISGNLILY